MTPPITNDWWLAAALTGASLPTALAQTQPATTHGTAAQSGVVTTATAGAPTTSAPLYIESAAGQKIATGPNEVKHVLFSDQSALTIGPNSQIVITSFRFDKQTQDGNLLIDMTKGLLRVVGGFLSKRKDTLVRTSTATIGIRGGITMVETNEQNGSATFLFGQQMSATDTNGNTQTVTRAGFATSFGGNQPPSAPERIPVNQLNAQLNRIESRPGPGSGFVLQQPSPAPAGQLITTGNTPGGSSSPGGTLANDRLKNVVDTGASSNPTNFTKTLTGTGLVQNQS